MALAFPSLPGIRPIRGLGDGVPQRDQGRVSKNLPLQSSSATRISMFGLWRPAPVCTKRTVLVSFAWSTVVETALRGEETSSCVTVPPRRKYCVRVMRFMITLGPQECRCHGKCLGGPVNARLKRESIMRACRAPSPNLYKNRKAPIHNR